MPNRDQAEGLLSQTEIDKIKAEELLRKRLQQNLNKDDKEENKVWKFLNSSFGLFLLSGVLLTAVSNFISKWYQERSEEIALRKENLKYFTEIDYRISSMDILLSKIDTTENFEFKRIAGATLHGVIEGDTIYYFPTNKEFINSHFLGLITWINYNSKGQQSTNDAYEQIKIFQGLKDDNWIYDVDRTENALNILQKFRDDIKLEFERTK